MFIRGRLKTALLLILLVLASPLEAKMLPWNIGVDSWFGVDYLVSRQDILYRPTAIGVFQKYGAEWNPRVPALTGMVELSPFSSASARLIGTISVGPGKVPVIRNTSFIPGPFRWDLRTDFGAWEAAGLYHLWNGGGYRFSVTGGYRREVWLYHGEPAGGQSPDSSLREELRSDIPFIGLQTGMNFPFWKARFEILGSWFMTKKIQQSISQNQATETMDGSADTGGSILLRMEGEARIRPTVTLGAHALYSYQEFAGRSLVTTNAAGAAIGPYEFDYDENVFAFGVHVGVEF